MKPVIFLDFDGVLNRQAETIGCPIIEPRPAKNLNTLIQHTDARLVIISSWRKWLIDDVMDYEGFNLLLQTHGVAADIVGYLQERSLTPIEKAESIRHWIKRHAGDLVCRYVVIDDQPLEIDNLVQTDPTQGLTCNDVVKAYRILRDEK